MMAFLWDSQVIELGLGINPARELGRVHKGKHYHPWPDHVVAFAFQVASPRERLILSLFLYTGQRGVDVVRMRWADYDGDAIHVAEQQKTKDVADSVPLVIPVLDELHTILEATPRKGEYIIDNAWRRPYSGRQTLSKAIKAILIRIKHPQYSTHGLRANAACLFWEAGCTDQEVMAITGHKDLGSLRRYLKKAIQKRNAQSAVRKLRAKRMRAGFTVIDGGADDE
jgi:integrase